MRLVVLSLCGALLAAGVASAAPAERAAVLERVRVAIPKVLDFFPMDDMLSGPLRKSLVEQNPGKEAAIEPIVDRLGACLVKIFDSLDYAAAVVEAADKAGMTDEELITVAAYYEDPAWKLAIGKMVEAVQTESESDIDPPLLERLEQRGKDPAVVRFNGITEKVIVQMFDFDALSDDIVVCTADFDAAVDDAGLINTTVKVEVISADGDDQ